MKNKQINVNNLPISIIEINDNDYISLTDMAKAKGNEYRSADVIKNWIRNRGTLEFLGTWEQINNQNFKVVEFDHFKKERVKILLETVKEQRKVLDKIDLLKSIKKLSDTTFIDKTK